jgi:hypothetical protein
MTKTSGVQVKCRAAVGAALLLMLLMHAPAHTGRRRCWQWRARQWQRRKRWAGRHGTASVRQHSIRA